MGLTKYKKLLGALLACSVLVALGLFFFVWPFNVYVDSWSSDTLPAQGGSTVYLARPIDRNLEPCYYLGKTLVYQASFFHECGQRWETHCWADPAELEPGSFELKSGAVGELVASYSIGPENFGLIVVCCVSFGLAIALLVALNIICRPEECQPENEPGDVL